MEPTDNDHETALGITAAHDIRAASLEESISESKDSVGLDERSDQIHEGDDDNNEDPFGEDNNDEEDDDDEEEDEEGANADEDGLGANDQDDEGDEDFDLDAPSKVLVSDDLPRPDKSKKKKRKRESNRDPKNKKAAKTKGKKFRFFDDEAMDAEDEEDEEPDAYDRLQGEEVLDEDAIEARRRVELRHQLNRERLNTDAKELAARYEEAARQQARMKQMNIYDAGGMGAGARGSSVLQQSLLPSIADPSIWRVKVSTGKEQQLVLAVMRKALAMKLRGGTSHIKSAFTTTSKGFIYIEAIAEPLAREAIMNLRGVYNSSLTKIPVAEMTSLLSVTVSKRILKIGDYVRIKRGPLKDDLAEITDVLDGGERVVIRAVPRPDYNPHANRMNELNVDDVSGKKTLVSTNKARPIQQLFDAQLAIKSSNPGEYTRRFHPFRLDRGEKYDHWGNEYYKDGFLMKEVNPLTFLRTVDVNPRIEEKNMFLKAKLQSEDGVGADLDDDEDDEDDDENEIDDDDEDEEEKVRRRQERKEKKKKNKEKASHLPTVNVGSDSLITQYAEQFEGQPMDVNVAAESISSPFVAGDLVQITGGELRNLVVRVLSINELTRSARVIATNTAFALKGDFEVELAILVRYVTPGAHVKVVSGQYAGQTGRVVNVASVEGRNLAVLLTDSVNSEIQCDVVNLQISNDVTTGLGSLMGYELYDLVQISDNEFGIVISVGTERLTLLDNTDNTREVSPVELRGKRNFQSLRSVSLDGNGTKISVGDFVNVSTGTYARRSGTVKHMMKATIWVHSNLFLKNSGVFAIRARTCNVAGTKLNVLPQATHSSAYAAPVGNRSNTGGGGGFSALPGNQKKFSKDTCVGQTIRITKGSYKGLVAQIVDSTATHYSVELLAKLKKITIDKTHTVLVAGGKDSGVDRRLGLGDGSNIIPSTPFAASETPHHYVADTPMHGYGSETPIHYDGGMTPSGGRTPYGEDVWRVNASDTGYDIHTGGPGAGAGIRGGDGSSVSGSGSGGSGAYAWGGSGSYGGGAGVGSSPSSDSWSVGGSKTASSGPGSGSIPVNYSPSISSSSAYSPTGALSDYSPNAGNLSPDPAERPADWVDGMVLVFTGGTYAGQLAVIRPSDDGSLYVQHLLGENNLLAGRKFQYPAHALRPAELSKNAKAIVLTGPKKGTRGVVKSFVGEDVILESEGNNEMFKASSCAMIFGD